MGGGPGKASGTRWALGRPARRWAGVPGLEQESLGARGKEL